MKLSSLFSLLLILALPACGEEFQSLFNGKNLDGWEGEKALWSVVDGIVKGTCEGPDAFPHNTFLIWKGGVVKNFELKATMRIRGDNNSGIQYRSRKIPEFGPYAIAGYQCDVHPATQHLGMTYEEKGRGIFGLNGNIVALDENAARWLLSQQEPIQADLSEWTEFTILAQGNHLIHKVNGKVTSELFDYDENGRALEGLLAIQLHRGNAHTVEIKEMKLRELPDVPLQVLGEQTLSKAKRIEKPRTSNPQGVGAVEKKKQ